MGSMFPLFPMTPLSNKYIIYYLLKQGTIEKPSWLHEEKMLNKGRNFLVLFTEEPQASK